MQEPELIPLIEKYLASIPQTDEPPVLRPDQITALPHHFPQGVVTEDVRQDSAIKQSSTIFTSARTFPIVFNFAKSSEDHKQGFLVFLSSLVSQYMQDCIQLQNSGP